MRNIKAALVFVFVFILTCNLKAQKYPLSDFVETQPKSWDHRYFPTDFEVNVKKGKLQITEYQQRPDGWFELEIDQGTLMAIDSGEFGGELRYVDNTGSSTHIKDGNVRFLFNYHKDVYFVESLAHMGLLEGGLFKLVWHGDTFTYTYEKIVDFVNEAP
ncbi:MAG: hypothetical protein JST19_11065, partial [Bacteroidetes bacterium]|nr:hypothetical protein [Bacteroidota bacterium]